MQTFAALAAISLYLSSFAVLLKQVKNQQVQTFRNFFGLFTLAIISHIFSLHFNLFGGQVLHLGLFKVLSLIFCVIAIISLIASLRRLEIENLILILLPFAAMTVAISEWIPIKSDKIVQETGLIIHIVLSIVAYSLITLATLQALLLGAQERQLRQHNFNGLFRYLPPLQTMETLLFDMILVGTILLTLAIGSGFVFLEDMFAQHLSHKTVLSIIAWVLFSTLLWGHYQKGWRGPIVVKWTVVGSISLMLAYFGSKFVLEIVL